MLMSIFCKSVPKNPYGGKPNEKQGPPRRPKNKRGPKKEMQGKVIKTNWAQDPFDPVNIIWPTKAQIILYKKIGVKTNMKKHNAKKQGTSRSQQQELREGKKSQTKGNDKHSRKRM